MRIAKPLLAVTTPLGVGLGLHQAWRIDPKLAVLMGIMLAVLGAFVAYTVRRIRLERGRPNSAPAQPSAQSSEPSSSRNATNSP
jgi:hypothetical protein